AQCRWFLCSSRRRHTRFSRDWSSDVCSSDLSSELVPARNGSNEDERVSGGYPPVAFLKSHKRCLLCRGAATVSARNSAGSEPKRRRLDSEKARIHPVEEFLYAFEDLKPGSHHRREHLDRLACACSKRADGTARQQHSRHDDTGLESVSQRSVGNRTIPGTERYGRVDGPGRRRDGCRANRSTEGRTVRRRLCRSTEYSAEGERRP